MTDTKKQTAVEWLREQLTFEYEGELLSSNHEDKNLKKYFEQALEMEREQIEEAYGEGLGYGTSHYIGDATDEEIDPANYYERTYGTEAQP
jgi:hypothetical protein